MSEAPSPALESEGSHAREAPARRRGARRAAALAVALGLAAVSGSAGANGRPPGTSSIHFRRGMESHVIAGMTFGLVTSRDGGASWQWVCEDAIGYGGMYDPDYELTASGALFATTFDGIQESRDGCRFEARQGKAFVSVVAQGPSGALFRAAADNATPTSQGDSKIYRSDDDGMTWPVASSPGIMNDWWQTLEVAPSDGRRVYLSGYRFEPPPGGGANIKKFLLFRSDDAGVTWRELPVAALATRPNSTIDIVGISYQDPNRVYARVTLVDNNVADRVYRSDDGGVTWVPIRDQPTAIRFLVRRSGEIVVATLANGAERSSDHGVTWVPLASPPHINCLAESATGEVWACTQNYGSMAAPSDGAGIMKSRDLATWTPVLRYQDLDRPVSCADGTVQQSRCDAELWCGLCAQLGCDAKRACGGATDGPEAPSGGGCCRAAGGAPAGAALLALGAAVLLGRRRRRARR
jgi:hypothetical protein